MLRAQSITSLSSPMSPSPHTQALVEEAGKAGASAYLAKPPRADEIGRAMAMARHEDLMTLITDFAAPFPNHTR